VIPRSSAHSIPFAAKLEEASASQASARRGVYAWKAGLAQRRQDAEGEGPGGRCLRRGIWGLAQPGRQGAAKDVKAQGKVRAIEIGIAIAIGIEIEIVSTVALDRMRLANLVASIGETVEQGRDSSIPIPIPIPIPIAISMEAPQLFPPALCASRRV